MTRSSHGLSESATSCREAHGASRVGMVTPDYRRWTSMKNRCLNANATEFPRYGGRGITVCERWCTSFASFLADMGPCPSPAHTLDRIDNDGPYSPENCRWATRSEQARNRRSNHVVSLEGGPRCVAQLAEETGIPANTLIARARAGRSGAALVAPIAPPARRAKTRLITLDGETLSLAEWGRRNGISRVTIGGRLARGWSERDACTISPGRRPKT